MTTFALTLAPVGDGPPPDLRIKSLFKTALRRHRLRRLSIQAQNPHQSAQDATPGMRMSRQSFPPPDASEEPKNASNRPSGQRMTAEDKRHELQRP